MTLTPEILPNGDLKISADGEERARLRQRHDEAPDSFGSNDTLYEMFEPLIANSEYDWVAPEHIGALTAAPILGIYGEPIAVPNGGAGYDGRLAGTWEDDQGLLRDWIEPVQQAWGFMDYALRSPQDDLLEQGYSIFVRGE